MTELAQESDPQREINEIIQSARALGVEVDEEEAIQWLTTMAAMDQNVDSLAVDHEAGVFGHRVDRKSVV